MAINPLHFRDWALENLLVVVTVILIWRVYPKLHLSNVSFTLIAIFMATHTLGSHYTYADVPLGFWISDLFDLGRNHYDRFIHFSFGLLIFWPMREVASLVIGTKKHWDGLIGLLFIISMSAIYEAIEWLVAITISPDTALLFLGTQGDHFDAQKDHTLAITGAIIAFLFAKWLAKKNRLPKPS
ncbi:MAG: DUF2238 domain-containing protein [Sphingomonadales bacterium]